MHVVLLGDRANEDVPATMLIHTHHRKPVQNRLGGFLRGYVSELRQSWRYDRESIRPELRARWNDRFRPVTVSVDVNQDTPFKAIEESLDRLFRDPLPVLVLNSDSTDELDYEADPSLKAIVVGGNRLSRGLTLEGLLVSFYIRRTECFDTLMQMGRWFGFRENHVDLTRIWTTGELAGWFRDLALAEEELRREISRYERENLTPLDFGPRIRSHPAMMITARNKMGNARSISQNYSGYLLQTTAFRLNDRRWLESNLDAARQLIVELGEPTRSDNASQPAWIEVPWQTVDSFLARYLFDPQGSNEMGAIAVSDRRPTSHQMRRFLQEAEPCLARIRQIAWSLTRHRHDAEDLCQETLLKALRSLEHFEPGTDVQNWMITILRRVHIDHWRWQEVRGHELVMDAEEVLTLADVPTEPETRAMHTRTWDAPDDILGWFDDERMIAELRRLPQEIRWSVLFREVVDMCPDCAAKRMDVPVGTVGSRAFRGREILRERFRQWAERRGWLDDPSDRSQSDDKEKRTTDDRTKRAPKRRRIANRRRTGPW